MNTLRIIIEKSADSYGAYAESIDGIYGAGDTLQEVKKSIDNAILTVKTFEKHEIPKALLEEHELKFVFDTKFFGILWEDIKPCIFESLDRDQWKTVRALHPRIA